MKKRNEGPVAKNDVSAHVKREKDREIATSGDSKRVYFDFLNRLRTSGATNMFGAAPYLVDRFGIEREHAKEILIDWMDSF